MSDIADLQREVDRLKQLRDFDILDTAPEEEFDELVQLAAEVCGTPMSMVSLIDERRQWFKAAVGITIRETPRDISFCAHAIEKPELFMVENATKDPRFAGNPMVQGEQNIRFYAGMPLESPGGLSMGTLCVIDTVPRTLTESQQNALKVLAHQVRARMELRLQRKQLEAALEERERSAAILEASERRFRLFMDNSPFMSYMKDARGRFLYYNAKLADQFKVSKEAWLGQSDADLFPREVAEGFRNHDLKVLTSGMPAELTEEIRGADGTISWWKSYRFPCEDEKGHILLGGVAVDMTADVVQKAQLERANERLEELATTDTLTGLLNRRVFEENLHIEFAKARRQKRALSVMLIDVDNFKRRNDVWGHAAGDLVLRTLAQVMLSTARESDVAAILLTDTSAINALNLAKRLIKRLKAVDWEEEPVTVSIGVANLDSRIGDPEALLRVADEGLYEAKRSGKDRVVVRKSA
jgi:diguanylate cyclase (GGDEF)-like protein/PAS domain S-box-containing protein